MAPTPVPVDISPNATAQPSATPSSGMNTPSIVGLSIFIFFVVAILVSLTAYYLHKRAQRNKLPHEKRPASYHPFRTNTAKPLLLDNGAPAPEEDRSSMFSRDRGSSFSLYVTEDVHAHAHSKRGSVETVSLIPLQVAPAEGVREDVLESVESGVSRASRASRNSGGSLRVSSAAFSMMATEEEGDVGGRRTRPRSTSTASARYYETIKIEDAALPTVPRIVHTPSP